MRRTIVKALLIATAVIGIVTLGLEAWRQSQWLSVDQSNIAFYADDLDVRGAFELQLPDIGDGPYPLVVIAHGCNGIDQVEGVYAAAAREVGWATLIVDSLGPRGIDEGWPRRLQVCTSVRLSGQDRVKDLLSTLIFASQNDDLDMSRLALAGFSHGAWASLDFLSATEDEDGFGWLDDQPGHDVSRPSVAGAYVNYPHCMYPSRTNETRKLVDGVRVRMNLGDDDLITLPGPCIDLARDLAAGGTDMTCRIYEGATHAYDEPAHEGKTFGRTIYNPDYAQASVRGFQAFLRSLNGDAAADEADTLSTDCFASD